MIIFKSEDPHATGSSAQNIVFDPRISIVGPNFGKVPTENPALSEIVRRIRTGEYDSLVLPVREEYRKNGKSVIHGNLKKGLPSFLFSGVFTKRNQNSLKTPSGVICLDFDGLSDANFVRLREEAVNDSCCVFCSTSPSGNGLKIGMKLTPAPQKNEDQHRAWLALEHRFFTPAPHDKQCKDLPRMCFVMSDPDIYYNPDCEAFPVPEPGALDDLMSLPDTDPVQMSGPYDFSGYCEKHLDDACQKIRTAPEGGRHEARIYQSNRVGRMSGLGFDLTYAAQALKNAALANTTTPEDAEKDIEDGVKNGMEKPDDPETVKASFIGGVGQKAKPKVEIPEDFETGFLSECEKDPGAPYIPKNKEIIAEIRKDEARWARLRDRLKRIKSVQITALDKSLLAEKTASEALSDSIRSKMLLKKHGEDIKWCHDREKWMVWNGKRWEYDDQGKVGVFANDIVDTLKTQHQSARNITNMMKLAAPKVPVSQTDFDKNPHLLNLENGIYDLDANSLSAHNREALQSQMAGSGFEADATCPVWEKCLSDWFLGDAEMVNFIRRAVGYSLLGKNPEHALFILHGNGNNGKSVFLNTIADVFGEYAKTTPMDTFLSKQSEATNDLAAISKARLVIASESDDGKVMSTSLVKRMTGGDPVTCRFLFQEYFTYTPGYAIFLAVNHKPAVRNQDAGIWRRLKLIPFDFTVPDNLRDGGLEEKLKAEIPGILAWALRGWAEYAAGGLAYPERVLSATAAYREDEDRLGDFFRAACVVDKKATAPQPEIYKAYVNFCEENGEKSFGKKNFNAKLREQGFTEKKTKKEKLWVGIGIRLRSEPPAEISEPEPDQCEKCVSLTPENLCCFLYQAGGSEFLNSLPKTRTCENFQLKKVRTQKRGRW